MSDAPIFTEKFCQPLPPLLQRFTFVNPISIPYQVAEHGEKLEIFERHKQFRQFKQQYFRLIDQLAILSREYPLLPEQRTALEDNISTFKEHLFNPGYCDARPENLWNLAREHLEALVHALRHCNKTAEQKATLLNNLSPNLTVCVDGLISHLQDLLRTLLIHDNIILKSKEKLVEQLVMQFIQEHNLSYGNYNVHETNAFINLFSRSLGLIYRDHEQTVVADNRLIQKNKQACQDYLFEKLPFAIVSDLTDELLSARQQALQANPSKPWENFSEFPIAQLFADGDILHSLFNSDGLQDTDMTPQKVYLLQIKVADHLIKQQWLQGPVAQKLLQVQSGNCLPSLADCWWWIQENIEFADRFDAFTLLLDHQSIRNTVNDSNQHGVTLLMSLASYSKMNTESIFFKAFKKILSCSEINVNIKDNYDCTALNYAVYTKNLLAVEQLLLHPRLEPNIGEGTGKNYLHQIIQSTIDINKKIELIEKLIVHKAFDPNIKEQCGNPAFHEAIRLSEIAIAKKLLSHRNFNPNEADHYGNTPLLVTISSNHSKEEKLSLLKKLLQHPNINPNLASHCGRSPFELILYYVATEEEKDLFWEKLLQHPTLDKKAIRQVAKRWGSPVVNAVESLSAKNQPLQTTFTEPLPRKLTDLINSTLECSHWGSLAEATTHARIPLLALSVPPYPPSVIQLWITGFTCLEQL